MTKKALRATLAFFFIFLLLFSIIPGIAQADIGAGGTTTLKSDIELMSGIPVHGGGHFTWVISGSAANELRIKIIEFFDGYVDGIPNGRLEYAEVDAYRIELERYLEDNEHEYMGANLRRFALLNRDIRDDTKGLIDTSASSTGNIEIRFYFDAWMPSGESKREAEIRALQLDRVSAGAFHRHCRLWILHSNNAWQVQEVRYGQDR
jgi:hypothetical protein